MSVCMCAYLDCWWFYWHDATRKLYFFLDFTLASPTYSKAYSVALGHGAAVSPEKTYLWSIRRGYRVGVAGWGWG